MPSPTQAAPIVLVSIKPIHSLVAYIAQGIFEPTLLISRNQSEHHTVFLPSDLKKIHQAELIFWVGKGLENHLASLLDTIPKSVISIPLLKTPDINLLPLTEDPHHAHQHESGPFDPHIWLDPVRAILMGKYITEALSKIDPANAHRYRNNNQKLKAELEVLHLKIKTSLKKFSNKSFLTFHNAYAYFSDGYKLKNNSFVIQDPEKSLGAKHLLMLREKIIKENIHCIFKEPQFSDRTLRVLTEKTEAKIYTIDPIGANLTPGPRLYFELLEGILGSLALCEREN